MYNRALLPVTTINVNGPAVCIKKARTIRAVLQDSNLIQNYLKVLVATQERFKVKSKESYTR